MNDGIYYDLSRCDYDAIEAVNFSTFKNARRSLLHYRHSLTARHDPTDAMTLGTAVHLAVLEPTRYADEVVMWDGGVRRSKAWDAFQELNRGRLILTVSQERTATEIGTAVRANRHAATILETGRAEVTLVWTDPATGTRCKARVDWVDPVRRIVADLKTARDIEPRAFGRSAHAMGYHLQLAWYAWGLLVLTGDQYAASIIAVESSPPCDVALYRVEGEALDVGTCECLELLSRVSAARVTNRWPGQCPEPLPLMLPAWALEDDSDDDAELGMEV